MSGPKPPLPWLRRGGVCSASLLPSPASRQATVSISTSIRTKETAMRREGSALNGIGVVTLKELDDNLTSVRMRVLEVLIVLFAIVAVYLAIQQVRDTTAEDPFLLLRLFTRAREGI